MAADAHRRGLPSGHASGRSTRRGLDPHATVPRDPPGNLQRIQAMRAEAGQTGPFQVTLGAQVASVDDVHRWEDAGATRLLVSPFSDPARLPRDSAASATRSSPKSRKLRHCSVDLQLDDLVLAAPQLAEDVIGMLGELGRPGRGPAGVSSNCTGLAISVRWLPSRSVTGTM